MVDAAEVHLAWLAAMRAGHFEAAWQQTDRLELPRREAERAGGSSFVRGPQHLLWNGTAFAGQRVLVRCEHGLGDTIQFIRFVPRLNKLAASVAVLAQPALVPLLTAAGGFGTVLGGWKSEPPPEHDVEIECMELAYALRCTAETLPKAYLSPERIKHAARKTPIEAGEDGVLKVGLLWGASEWDCTRSIPLALLAPFGSVPNVAFFGLQQGPAVQDLAHPPFPVRDLSPDTASILDAAAAMLDLDLIITVDTMAAHLAGALERPVWLLLQHDADWRWMRHRTDSRWYPSMRLFRQPRPGDWAGVVSEVLAAFSAPIRPPNAMRPMR